MVKIIIADDMEDIHNDIRAMLKETDLNTEYEFFQDFYSTRSLLGYLNNPQTVIDGSEILILDHDFGGIGRNGLDILPELRSKYPNLPIIMLTTYGVNRNFETAVIEFDITYLRKPIDAGSLAMQIRHIIQHHNTINELWDMLNENEKELVDAFNRLTLVEYERDKAAHNSQVTLSADNIKLVKLCYPNLEFSERAFNQLTIQDNNELTTSRWIGFFFILRSINDAKPYNENITKQSYRELSGCDVYEYKYGVNNRLRVFTQEVKGIMPFIFLVTPSHSYKEQLRGMEQSLKKRRANLQEQQRNKK